ncbi:MAG: amidohydrolase family protein, partial [candidate division Zixibacteria bacterium]|nr:amidohydrolase family protein [candidate division Zixibacteria bacterium]
HAFPREYKSSRKKYIDLITNKMIPEIAGQGLAEFCDVFCEKGYFTPAESKSILETGKKFGLKPKIHAEEFGNYGGARVAAGVGAVSADHLMHASLADISRMKKAGVVAVLLPGTSFFLNSKRYAPARQMIQKNLPVALATDFNPGSNMSESMQVVMTLACLKLKMTPAEALTASTINAAYALDRGGQIGSIEPDKKADLVIWEVEDYRQIPYHYGVNLVKMVVKDGDVVYEKSN